MDFAVHYTNFAQGWQNHPVELVIVGFAPSGLEVLPRAATLGKPEVQQGKTKDDQK